MKSIVAKVVMLLSSCIRVYFSSTDVREGPSQVDRLFSYKLTLRWRVIKGTLLAHNEQSAPFAVLKTFGYIRKKLAE
jgi:hypothetical protein